MRLHTALLALIIASSSAQAAPLPCDISPIPVFCYGMKLLKVSYARQPAVDVRNPNSGITGTIAFSPDGTFDTAALDTLLGTTTGLVTRWYDQNNLASVTAQKQVFLSGTTVAGSAIITGIPSTAGLVAKDYISGTNINFSSIINTVDSAVQVTMNQPALTSGTAVLTYSDAPLIGTPSLGGGSRSIIFNGANISGALFGLKTEAADISFAGITARDYSLVSVLRPAHTVVTNQAGAPGLSSGGFGELSSGAGVVTRVINNALFGDRGVFQVTDGTFNFDTSGTREGYSVPVTPIVLGITSDSTGVKIWINGEMRATAARSALTRTAATLWLGRLASSVAGATSNAGTFEIVAHLVYNVGLAQEEYRTVAAALQREFGIDPTISTYESNYLTNFSDSIGSGYVTNGLIGYMALLQPQLTRPAVVGSYGVPGSTFQQSPNQPAQPPTSTVALFNPAVCNSAALRFFVKNKVVIIHLPGNDALVGPPVRSGNTHSSTLIDNIANTADISVGDFISVSGLATLQSVLSKTANSITLTGATSTTLTGTNFVITFAALSPANYFTALQNMVNSLKGAQCGASTVIVTPILKRNEVYQIYSNAVNTLAAGVANATFVDCRVVGNLNTNPGPDYFDSGHMTPAGQADMATCLAATVNAAMIP